MSKELEAFKSIKTTWDIEGTELHYWMNDEDIDIVENGLKRLEAIDNANPSEALECFERIDNTLCLNNIKGKLEFGIDTEEHTDCDSVIGMTEDLETIKQALIKAQEPKHYLKCKCEQVEKSFNALEIIKKKCLTNCNLALVKDNLHYQNYCNEFEYFLNKYNESPNGFEINKEDLLIEEEFNLLKEMLK